MTWLFYGLFTKRIHMDACNVSPVWHINWRDYRDNY